MSALWSGWGADAFTEQVEKATSELLPVGSEDIALNLDICDQVRAKQVPAKQAMQVLKRRVSHKNPNVVLLALGLTDICIKNGGDHFLQEVASREFMDNLVSVLRNPSGVNTDVKVKALGLIQNWSQIAEARPAQMSYITDIYKQLKADSKFDFPPIDPNAAASAALVETLTAPEWVDGDVCMRCRTAFTTFNRKHHCRNCGNVFCQQCSSHSIALPWFGIGQDVRVCDGCFARKAPPKNAAKLSRSKSASSSSPSSSSKHIPSGRGGASSHHRSATTGSKSKRSARQKEQDELDLAIKLSLEASGQPETFATPSQPFATSTNAQRATDGRVLEGTDADQDPDLAAAIAASLRDWAPPQPSAPDGFNEASAPAPVSGASASAMYGTGSVNPNLPLPPSLDLAPRDVDDILTFSQNIQAQHTHNQRSGSVGAPVPQSVQMLYEKASAARPRMARNLEEGHRRHNVLVSMHDKLTEAVRLYDRLLDAQMTRPAQSYAPNGYTHAGYPAPSHQGYGYGYEQSAPSQAGSSSLYPQAPKYHEHQQYQPYGISQPYYAPQHQQQQHLYQQYQQPTEPNPASHYTNGVYADPSQATLPVGAAVSTQYGAYEYSNGPVDQASHLQGNGLAYAAVAHHAGADSASTAPRAESVVSQGPGPLSVRTDGIMGGTSANVSVPVAAMTIGASGDGQGNDSSRNGWNAVPIQAVAPLSQPESVAYAGAQKGQQQDQEAYDAYQQSQEQPPQQSHEPSKARVVAQGMPPVTSDTSYLPLFPVAPHPDNGFGVGRDSAEVVSPIASPYTVGPSSAGMWQSTAGKSSAVVNANVKATESPLIEF